MVSGYLIQYRLLALGLPNRRAETPLRGAGQASLRTGDSAARSCAALLHPQECHSGLHSFAGNGPDIGAALRGRRTRPAYQPFLRSHGLPPGARLRRRHAAFHAARLLTSLALLAAMAAGAHAADLVLKNGKIVT